MAKVGAPLSDNARTLARRQGVAYHLANAATSASTSLSIWQPDASTWDAGASTWNDQNFSEFTDAPRMWRDASRPWDFSSFVLRERFARLHTTTRTIAKSGVLEAIQFTRTAAIRWTQIGVASRAAWTGYALRARRDIPSRIENPVSGTWRFAPVRKSSGFSIFVRAYRESYPADPTPPSTCAPTWDSATSGWDGLSSRWENAASNYTEPLMIELLTGNTYESRMQFLLGEHKGKLDIAVYKAATNWSQPFTPSSSLFELLKAQPTLRGTCRIILSTTFLGTPTNPWNDAAANELAAAGWIVRRFAADP
ncbi:MAG: hypothetical protein ACRCWJ_17165, partial [Casimicrobium sp.]